MAVDLPKLEKGRYTGLIISIALLLSLIGALLAFTFYTSNLIERNTVLISETNQVANDAQAVSKDLFDVANSYGEDPKSPHMQRVLSRLEDNSQNIASSLVAIAHGGAVISDNGKTYDLPIIKSQDTLEQVRTAQQEWALLQPRINSYLRDASNVTVDSADELTAALDQAKTSSLIINQALDTLTNDVFVESQRQAELIRLIQVLGVIAILTYFVVFVFIFVRRLRRSDDKAFEARRETQEIMQTVSTGLFLLDKDLNIGQQHSKALEGIIGTDRLAGENFADILRGRISDKDLTTTRQFIEQLYNPRVKEKLVHDLNPLRKVMLHNVSEANDGASSYLDFNFSRVYEDKDIARILVNVTDVSEAVKLEQRLEQEREQNDMQIEMLTTILNVEPKFINEFIANTKTHIEKMNNILKNPGSSQFELESKLKSIYREMHSLKGEASALRLHSFTKIASDAEDKLYAMQNQGKLLGNDFLPLAVNLDELLTLSNTIETLGMRINQGTAQATPIVANLDATLDATQPPLTSSIIDIKPSTASLANAGGADNTSITSGSTDTAIEGGGNSHSIDINSANNTNSNHADVADVSGAQAASGAGTKNSAQSSSLIRFYQDFATEIAHRQGKKITLTTAGLTEGLMTGGVADNVAATIKEVIIQLLRNAIVHGIETPGKRLASNKSEVGHINLEIGQSNNQVVVSLKDDGRGIDYERIRQKLVETGQYDHDAAASLSEDALLATLFTSGFSTLTTPDEDGGRGVGLDIIKDRVESLQGEIVVNSKPGQMSEFVIRLPL